MNTPAPATPDLTPLPASILREYDVRGIVGETLTAKTAKALGQAFGTRIKENGGSRVTVGRDGRLSSPELEEALVEGLTSVGLDVWTVGVGPSPMLYFATFTSGADGGIMITGSHNPSNYNGFKMVIGTKPFFGDDIRGLANVLPKIVAAENKGSVTPLPIFQSYISRVVEDYHHKKDLTVVWDAGNGATGEVINVMTGNLPGNHILLNCEIDGTFPAHHPDPVVPKNLEQLMASVKEHNADVGIAFDGDGDRLGVIDSKGNILWGDQLLMIYAEELLQTTPGAPIIADVKASQSLFDFVQAKGGVPLMNKTGHSLIKQRMAETKAPLAGEMSGHMFFADKYFGYDDAVYAALRLLNILTNSEKTLNDIYEELPKTFATPEMRFECARKFEVVENIKNHLKAQGTTFSDVDGVRVSVEGNWWLLRASNTEDVLVARCEAHSPEALEKLKKTLFDHLTSEDVSLPA